MKFVSTKVGLPEQATQEDIDTIVNYLLEQDDPLTYFLMWYLEYGTSIGHAPFHNAVSSIGNVAGCVLLRQWPFQVQLFICPPNIEIPHHVHPGVDSYEVYVAGQVDFSVEGQSIRDKSEITFDQIGQAALRAHCIRIKPDYSHGGKIGAEGGVFMSVQKWSVPFTCITQNHGEGEKLAPSPI